MDHLAESERVKYEKIWEVDRYRVDAPGEKCFLRAWADLLPAYRDTLCDWGIGTGRAAAMFQKRGLRVEGIDIAHNANREFNGVVHIGTVWNPPISEHHKYLFSYCTDVMEHIPEEMIIDTLKQIRNHTIDASWFAIAMYPDKMGALVGETLHMTVRPVTWWAATFAEVFPRFRLDSDGRRLHVVAYTENLR